MMTESKLTAEQLEAFLLEISELNELPEDEAKAIRENHAWGFTDAEVDELTSKETVVTAAQYSKTRQMATMKEASEAARARNTAKKESRSETIRKIKEEAINDPFIDLYAPLEIKHKRYLIMLHTEFYRKMCKGIKHAISDDVYCALRPLIPIELIKAAKYHPDSILPMPPFKWTTFDNSRVYTIEFDRVVPNYFKDDVNIQTLLIENSDKVAARVDNNIMRFYRHNETLVKLEVNLAKQLAPMRNFYDLLKRKPIWYKELIDKLKSE